jgi:hypothetical protein
MMADDDLLLPPSDDKPVTLRDARERSRAIVAKELDDQAGKNFQLQVLVDRLRMSPVGPVNIAAGHLGVGLGDINRAVLPALYRNSVAALRECARIDECATMGNQAQVIATYARMAKDDVLLRLALRIRARALRRVGELLAQIPDTNRGRPKILEGDHPNLTRDRAAAEGGLSPWQRKTALRIVKMPTDEFEAAVESDHPATITTLAERGRGKRTAVARPRPAPSPEVVETECILIDHAYQRGLTLDEIARERQMAVLMHGWQNACAETRRRFLKTIGCPDFL